MKTIAGLLLATMLAMTAGCARTDWIDRTLVTVDVTGVWTGSYGRVGGFGEIRLELQQQGPTVTGHVKTTGLQSGRMMTPEPIEGSVAGDLFRFKDARGRVTAELTVSGDEMNGYLDNYEVSVRRIDSSPPPGLQKR